MADERRWRCLTCGFAWSKAEPPAVCPVCGAPKDQFAPIGQGKIRFLGDLLNSLRSHIHPILVHVPNGALPVGAAFLYLALLTGSADLERAAFFVLVAILLATPIAGVTGFADWKRRYGGRKVPVFYRKIGLAAALFVLTATAVALRGLNPELFDRGGDLLWLYALLVSATLPLLVFLGHWGGKLAFEWRKFPKPAAGGSDD